MSGGKKSTYVYGRHVLPPPPPYEAPVPWAEEFAEAVKKNSQSFFLISPDELLDRPAQPGLIEVKLSPAGKKIRRWRI